MSKYVQSHGPSLKHSRQLEREKNLHHLRIHGHPDGTPESPKWIVEHHSSENDSSPVEHEFDNGHDMLAHVAEHSAVSEDEERSA
jgi:hypothetical protein